MDEEKKGRAEKLYLATKMMRLLRNIRLELVKAMSSSYEAYLKDNFPRISCRTHEGMRALMCDREVIKAIKRMVVLVCACISHLFVSIILCSS